MKPATIHSATIQFTYETLAQIHNLEYQYGVNHDGRNVIRIRSRTLRPYGVRIAVIATNRQPKMPTIRMLRLLEREKKHFLHS